MDDIVYLGYPSCRNRITNQSHGPSIVLPGDSIATGLKESGKLRAIPVADRRMGFEELQEQQRKQPLPHIGGRSDFVGPLVRRAERVLRQRQRRFRTAAEGSGKTEQRLVV
jgi:hypothetical protein